ARLHDDRLADLKLLRRAVEQVTESYQQKKAEGELLWTLADYQPGPAASINWRGWHTEVQRFLSTITKPPFPGTEQLPGSASPDLTYQTVYAFESVRKAAAELEGVKNRLERLRDLTAALGLGVGADRALLAIPEDFTASSSGERLKQLRQAFPDFPKSFTDTKLPDAARGDVRQAAETSYKPLLEAGRNVVLAHLHDIAPNGPETPQMWRTLPSWSAMPVELGDWRIIARVLLRLADPDRADSDPIDDLNAFLG